VNLDNTDISKTKGTEIVKIASILLYIVSAITILSGLTYVFTPTIMSYHQRFLGKTHEQLEPKVAKLFLTLIRVVGFAFLSIGIMLAMLVKGYFSKGDNWAWWIILVMVLTYVVPLLFITLSIGPYTPWWLISVMVILCLMAMVISKLLV